jgi:hypothetical protein
MKKYRFFTHYNKQHDKMTVHFRGKCYIAKDIVCNPAVETKWNDTQPRLVLRGWCSSIEVSIDKIIIKN